MGTEKFNVIFKNYPESIPLSLKQAPKYWKKKDKIGVRMQKRIDTNEVVWLEIPKKSAKAKVDLALYDKAAHEFILKNAAIVGTPRMHRINAQDLWSSGHGMEFTRQKIRDYLHAWFTAGIVRQMPEEIFSKPGYYLQFEYIFYYPFAKNGWKQYTDYLNHAFIYSKVFEDCLEDLKVITNDGPEFVRGGYARYVDIMELDGNQDRRLEIKVHFCRNNERIS